MNKEFMLWVILTAVGILCGTVIPLIIAIVDRHKSQKKADEEKEKASIARKEAERLEVEMREAGSESELAQAEAEKEKQLRIATEAEARAKEEEAKANEAEAELLKLANKLVDETETLYKDVDQHLKQTTGKGAGSAKKAEVMTKMEITALKKGYHFDEAKWSDIIDGIVKMTRNVNAK